MYSPDEEEVDSFARLDPACFFEVEDALSVTSPTEIVPLCKGMYHAQPDSSMQEQGQLVLFLHIE